MFILLIACILITIICILFVSYLIYYKYANNMNTYKENYQSELDPNLLEVDALEYITKELNWKVDYNIDRYLPTPPEDPRYIAEEREEIINARISILKELKAMRYRVHSGVNISYQYIQACILRNDRVLDYLSRDSSCNLRGKILSYDKDDSSPDAKYGKRKTLDTTIPTFTFDNYIKLRGNNIDSITLHSLKNYEIHPSDGCIIETYAKEEFFDKITKLAFMKRYATEFDANNKKVENVKLMESNKSLNNTMFLYGIVQDNSYDTTLLPSKCETRTTQPVLNRHNTYEVFNKHSVTCGDDEALSAVKLKNEGGYSSYVYTCCKPQMKDNRIIMKPDSNNKYTECRDSDENYQKPWELSTDIQCDNYLNGFKLDIRNSRTKIANKAVNPIDNPTCKPDPDPKNSRMIDYYKYKCTSFDKRGNNNQDQRVIDKSCSAPKQTKAIRKISGVTDMPSLVMDCDGNFIKNIKKIEPTSNEYAYEYTCCKPTVNFPN